MLPTLNGIMYSIISTLRKLKERTRGMLMVLDTRLLKTQLFLKCFGSYHAISEVERLLSLSVYFIANASAIKYSTHSSNMRLTLMLLLHVVNWYRNLMPPLCEIDIKWQQCTSLLRWAVKSLKYYRQTKDARGWQTDCKWVYYCANMWLTSYYCFCHTIVDTKKRVRS